jgi:RNA polymerase sigma factor for flagellar operon FliA
LQYEVSEKVIGMQEYKVELTEAEKEKIINDSLPFIKYTAYRLSHRLPPQLSVEDLISVGVMGLLDALQRYTEGRVKLNTFTEYRIKGAMLDELRSHDWVPRSLKTKVGQLKKAHQQLEKDLGRLPEEEEVAKNLNLSMDEYYKILQEASSAVVFSFEDFRDRMHEESDVDVAECIADKTMKSPLEILEDSTTRDALLGRADDEGDRHGPGPYGRTGLPAAYPGAHPAQGADGKRS